MIVLHLLRWHIAIVQTAAVGIDFNVVHQFTHIILTTGHCVAVGLQKNHRCQFAIELKILLAAMGIIIVKLGEITRLWQILCSQWHVTESTERGREVEVLQKLVVWHVGYISWRLLVQQRPLMHWAARHGKVVWFHIRSIEKNPLQKCIRHCLLS